MSMDNDDAFADEIVEIFAEEVGEVLEQIDKHLSSWQANTKDVPALKEVRRAFHTLKGSGRMVQAEQIAELSWAVENMLNRVLDGSLAFHPLMVQLVEHVQQVIPALMQAFRNKQAAALAGVNIHLLIEQADALREGKPVKNLNDFTLSSEAAKANASVVSPEVPASYAAIDAQSSEDDDALNEQISDLLHRVDELRRDWLQMNNQVDVLKKAVQAMDSKKINEEVSKHLQSSDREIKELKYFIKTSSEEMLINAKQTQQRLTTQVDKDLRIMRDVIAQIELDQQAKNQALRDAIALQIKLWSLGCAIGFSILAFIAAMLM